MAEQGELPQVTFSTLITQLAAAAMADMAEGPNPITGEQEMDLARARFTIDAIGVLEEKTQGNLDDEEQKLLESLLDQLRGTFVERSRQSR